MQEFQQKQKIRNMLYSRNSFFLLAIITLLFIKGAWGVWQKQTESETKLKEAEKRLEEIQKRQATLNSNIERLNTPDGIEREIRERYSVKKDGEEVVLVVDAKEATVTEEIVEPSTWQRFSGWFMGLF